MPARTRAIYGCAGTELSESERAFYREAQPWGFILFARNVRDPHQVRALVAAMREAVGDGNAPVLVDQEGGRVARLKPPNWKTRPPPRVFGELYDRSPDAGREAAYLNARSMAHELLTVGIDVDCVPVLDVPIEGANDVIGDRAFAPDPEAVSQLGREIVRAMLDGGVLPVIKHMPGHGRANADSHYRLPRVAASLEDLRQTDFVPFRALNRCPLGMTAHVVYEAVDPVRPGTASPAIIHNIVRGEIGFQGLLLTDDLSMNALAGSLAERARGALAAGCDILTHCNGRIAEMEQVASEAKPLEGEALDRANAALAQKVRPKPFDVPAADARLVELIGELT